MDFNLFGNTPSGQGNRIADYFKGYAGYFDPDNIKESLGELGQNAGGAVLSGLDGAIKSVKAPVDFANMVSGGRLQGASDFFQRGSDAANALKPDSVRQAEGQPLVTRDSQGNRQFHLPNAQQLADFTATALPQIPQFMAAGGGARSLIIKGADYLPGLAAEMTRLAPILGYGAAGAAEGSGNAYSDVSRQARDQALAAGVRPEAAEELGRDEGARAAQAMAPISFAANALGMGGGSQAASTAGNAITSLFRAAGQNALAQFGQGGAQSGVEDMALGHGLDWDSILNNGYTSAMLGLPFWGGGGDVRDIAAAGGHQTGRAANISHQR